jgi:hypothetical protein
MTADSKILFNYTEPGSYIPSDAGDKWKGPGPQNQYEPFVGFKEVGVESGYTGVLRMYDELVGGWLKTFELYDAAKKEKYPVNNVVHGTPERLFAVNPVENVGSAVTRVTLPAISYRRTGITRRFDRGAVLRDGQQRLYHTDSKFKNYIEIKSTYHMLDLDFQIDLWTKYISEMQMLIEQVLLPFAPHAYFKLNIPDILFSEVILVRLSSITDTSQLETGDGDRLIRSTATIQLEGYLPVNVSKIARTIKAVQNDYVQVEYENTDSTNSTPASSSSETSVMEYTQLDASTIWTVNHGLGVNPANSDISVVDASNNPVYTFTVAYLDPYNLTLTFPNAISGTAYILIRG